jgi:hypothetical protein
LLQNLKRSRNTGPDHISAEGSLAPVAIRKNGINPAKDLLIRKMELPGPAK